MNGGHVPGKIASVTMREDFPLGCKVEHVSWPSSLEGGRWSGTVVGYTKLKVRVRWRNPHFDDIIPVYAHVLRKEIDKPSCP